MKKILFPVFFLLNIQVWAACGIRFPENHKLDNAIQEICQQLQTIPLSNFDVTGSSGNVLTAQKQGTPPIWQFVTKNTFNQFVSSNVTVTINASAATWVDTGLAVTVTPLSTGSTVYMNAQIDLAIVTAGSGTNACGLRLQRNGSTVVTHTAVMTQQGTTPSILDINLPFIYADIPGSTSAQTYKIQFNSNGAPASCQFNSQDTTAGSRMDLWTIPSI